LTQIIFVYICGITTQLTNAMSRTLKIFLIVLGSLIVLALIAGGIGYYYLKSSFISFDYKDAMQDEPIPELTLDGYTFSDLNRNGELDLYEDFRVSLGDRVEDVLGQMTTQEKIRLLKGSGMNQMMRQTDPDDVITGVAGTILSIPRLGLPTFYLSDGPAGLRLSPPSNPEDIMYCTAFPIGTQLASTWDTELVEEVGRAMGNEVLEYGVDVILGPAANIHRNPLCGRNFEYYSEDPVLSGWIGAAMVNGIESNGVGTSVKHFVANNQETDRNKNNVIISERALREIYLKGFEIMVKNAQPWTIMSSYNKINGTFVSEDKRILTDILRDEWGFEGLVMTDWFGGDDAVAQVKAGNDLLEPGTKKQYDALKEAAERGELSKEDIDIAVSRILSIVLQSPKLQGYQFSFNPDLEAHAAITRRSAAEGSILLKNEGALPLKSNQTVALFGVRSYDLIVGGTGSGDVVEPYSVSLDQGLVNAGFSILDLTRAGYEAHKAKNPAAFEKLEGIQAMLDTRVPPEWIPAADTIAQAASASDLAIITIGRNSGEGYDRVEGEDFLLTDGEQQMIREISRAFQDLGKKVIVVLNIGGVIETASWKDQPDAILLAWQGGQEGGNAIADVLTGEVNPSGKLPMTFPVALSDHASNINFPQDGEVMDFQDFIFGSEEVTEMEWVKNKDYTRYEEGVFVGYRHFATTSVPVSYPFGYGLNYTTFDYQDIAMQMENDSIKVMVTVANNGNMAGKEAVQLYTAKPKSKVERPEKELRMFGKTAQLGPGASEVLQLIIPVSELAYWDEGKDGWVVEPGSYQIQIGASSADIRWTGEVSIPE
jgi:beta-glucosidase